MTSLQTQKEIFIQKCVDFRLFSLYFWDCKFSELAKFELTLNMTKLFAKIN